jgi:hypothetical protein
MAPCHGRTPVIEVFTDQPSHCARVSQGIVRFALPEKTTATKVAHGKNTDMEASLGSAIGGGSRGAQTGACRFTR